MTSELPQRRFGRRLCVERFEPRLLLATDFAAQEITVDLGPVNETHAADLDGDGDLDILVAISATGRQISWYENTDGLGHFGPQRAGISTKREDGSGTVEAIDIDGDDDLDLLVRFGDSDSYQPQGIAWRENTDGLGNFGPIQVIRPLGTETWTPWLTGRRGCRW